MLDTDPNRHTAGGKESPMATIQKIVPCLWFDTHAEEAAKFYISVFPNSRIDRITHYTGEGKEIHGHEPGSIMTVTFELSGCLFTALNGGPNFKFSEAVSFQVMCDTQEEIDRYWSKLTPGGDENAQQCGWLCDKFGLSWQIVPTRLPELLSDDDPVKVGRTMNALLQMKKLDIARLEQAHAA
jgi:predicted 3-demethylubiquinone-9 3-methyltransferase (glyoxalase superfamily)